jgi:putative membrane protein insertion efficiency factor
MSKRAPVLWPRRLLAAPIRAYRFFFSPWLGSACRFEPTCSRYALEALDTHGACAGTYLAAKRVLRCHPWCHGGFDPVPTASTVTTPSQDRLPS